jgi:triosephosphate isomerase (TIM)
MPERTPILAANWKMNKTRGEAQNFVVGLQSRFPDGLPDGVEVVLSPPFTAIEELVGRRRGVLGGYRIAAQNMHEEPEGAFTGEVSAAMLLDVGATDVILGHSERRQYFNETDDALSRKVPAALEADLRPILCVGENEAQRDSDETEGILTRQIEADLADIPEDRLADVVIAYEPIWAIGTGRTATPEQAQEACALIRGLIESRSSDAAVAIRILYGGSVKSGNAAELISLPDVDGALVGGASLDPSDFAAIVEAAT